MPNETSSPIPPTEKEQILTRNHTILEAISNRKQVVSILSFSLVLCLILILSLLYAILFYFPVRQFLWTSDARPVCAAIPISKPSISAARVVDFASTAAIDLNSYDYLNWSRLLGRAMDLYLTPQERMNFEKNLNISGIIQDIKKNNMDVSAIINNRPFIIQEGVRAGDHRYFWKIQVPLTLYYYNQTDSRAENRILIMTIVRIDPSPLNPNGIAIDEFISVQDTSHGNQTR